MPATPAFRRCATCTHASVTRAPACGLCGGALADAPPPEDLFTGWRCACWHCLWRPC